MDDLIERTGICGFDHENRKYTKGTFGQRRFPLFCLSADMSCVKNIKILSTGDGSRRRKPSPVIVIQNGSDPPRMQLI